jgi:hypothetical protein
MTIEIFISILWIMFRPFLDRIERSLTDVLLDGTDGIRRIPSGRKLHIGSGAGVFGLERHAPEVGRTKQRATDESIMTTMAVGLNADHRLAGSLDARNPQTHRAGAFLGPVTDTMSGATAMMGRPVARGPPLLVLYHAAA